MILEVRDASGRRSTRHRRRDPGDQPAGAYITTNILMGNTEPSQNPIWAEARARNGPRAHRPAAVKTGTANEARDLRRTATLPRPRSGRAGAAVGIWMGNSDHSNPQPSSGKAATSLTAAAPLWRAYVRDITAGTPVADFPIPDGLARYDRRLVGRTPGPGPGPGQGVVHRRDAAGAGHAIDPTACCTREPAAAGGSTR